MCTDVKASEVLSVFLSYCLVGYKLTSIKTLVRLTHDTTHNFDSCSGCWSRPGRSVQLVWMCYPSAAPLESSLGPTLHGVFGLWCCSSAASSPMKVHLSHLCSTMLTMLTTVHTTKLIFTYAFPAGCYYSWGCIVNSRWPNLVFIAAVMHWRVHSPVGTSPEVPFDFMHFFSCCSVQIRNTRPLKFHFAPSWQTWGGNSQVGRLSGHWTAERSRMARWISLTLMQLKATCWPEPARFINFAL